MLQCPGCDSPFDINAPKVVDLKLEFLTKEKGSQSVHSAYCNSCSRGFLFYDPEYLYRKLQETVRDKFKVPVPISEELVREISENMGASKKLTEALVEKIFGSGWTGKIPEGASMTRYANRDRLVAFVAAKLKDLWTLEA